MSANATAIIEQYVEAKHNQHLAEVYLPARHPDRRAANGAMATARNMVKRAGFQLCGECHGHGSIQHTLAPRVVSCKHCEGTGYQEFQTIRGEWQGRVCFNCRGARVMVYNRFETVTCPKCNGTRTAGA